MEDEELLKITTSVAVLKNELDLLEKKRSSMIQKRIEKRKIQRLEYELAWPVERKKFKRLRIIYKPDYSESTKAFMIEQDFPKDDWPEECFNFDNEVKKEFLEKLNTESGLWKNICEKAYLVDNLYPLED